MQCPKGQIGKYQSKIQQRAPRLTKAKAVTDNLNELQKLGRVLQEKAARDFERVFSGTSKSRQKLGVVDELLTYWNLDETDDILEELEDVLLSSDFGPDASTKVTDQLREKVKSGEVQNGPELKLQLKQTIINLLQKNGGDSTLQFPEQKPAVMLIIGVNGGGKTTTIGKLANQFKNEGLDVLLGAGDTFRAAAQEQLTTWAKRSGVDIYPESTEEFLKIVAEEQATVAAGNDPSAGRKNTAKEVLRDTIKTGKEKGSDIIICDTSGRLHNDWRLMDQLKEIREQICEECPSAPHETLLVLDGTTGLNMVKQADEFNQKLGITGLVLTKLDGTARGGAVVTVVERLGVPVKFIGVGEGIDDLQPFDAKTFVDGLLPDSEAK